MQMRHRRWLIAALAAAALCLIGIAPESAYAATRHTASTPASASITKQAAVAPSATAAVAPSATTACDVTADVEATSGWGAVIGTGVFDGCVGDGPTPVDCHVQAVIQGESGLTSGFTDLLEAPSEPGCAPGSVSSGNVLCPTTKGEIAWTYRAQARYSVHWSDGSTSTGSVYSKLIGSEYQCDSLV